LVMNKKKARKIRKNENTGKIWLITNILLIHNNLWFGFRFPEKQCYQINPFFPTLKMKSFCVITAVHIAISQIFFWLMHWKIQTVDWFFC
jgi:hypothetical protein